MSTLPSVDPVSLAIAKWSEFIQVVASHKIPVAASMGYVLAEDLRSDRDSPAIDVSAMDGFAIRMSDWSSEIATNVSPLAIPIEGSATPGTPPTLLMAKSARRIFTGAPIPIGADTVIVREQTTEVDGKVTLTIPLAEIRNGQNVRFRGENLGANEMVLSSGTYLSANAFAAVATFAPPAVSVRRKLNVSIINTGDELVSMGNEAKPWQIHDSNGPYLEQYLRQQPWISSVSRQCVEDSPFKLLQCINDQLNRSDVIILTGGVSMGDYDYVPEMIRQSGSKIVFHRLPIRPGKPVLGAVGPSGQLICGLPGNPVSVAVTARRFALPMMRKMAGLSTEDAIHWMVEPPKSALPPLDLIHYRLCTIDRSGDCQWTPMNGSGDIIALTRSQGFLEIPPNFDTIENSPRRLRFYPW